MSNSIIAELSWPDAVSRDEMKRLVRYGFDMGWLSVRPDATLPEPRKIVVFDKDLSPDLRKHIGKFEDGLV